MIKKGTVLIISAVIIILGIYHTGSKITVEKGVLNGTRIVAQMFPDSNVQIMDNNIFRVYRDGDSYDDFILERVFFGRFIDKPNDMLVVLRRSNSSHAAGLYSIVLGVFDYGTGRLKSSVKHLGADEVELQLFEGRERTYLMFVGSTTFQGWTEYLGALYEITQGEWAVKFPGEQNFWENKKAVTAPGKLLLFVRNITGTGSSGIIPGYKYDFSRELVWDPSKEIFIERE